MLVKLSTSPVSSATFAIKVTSLTWTPTDVVKAIARRN
jgi:hypothetical protein